MHALDVDAWDAEPQAPWAERADNPDARGPDATPPPPRRRRHRAGARAARLLPEVDESASRTDCMRRFADACGAELRPDCYRCGPDSGGDECVWNPRAAVCTWCYQCVPTE